MPSSCSAPLPSMTSLERSFLNSSAARSVVGFFAMADHQICSILVQSIPGGGGRSYEEAMVDSCTRRFSSSTSMEFVCSKTRTEYFLVNLLQEFVFIKTYTEFFFLSQLMFLHAIQRDQGKEGLMDIVEDWLEQKFSTEHVPLHDIVHALRELVHDIVHDIEQKLRALRERNTFICTTAVHNISGPETDRACQSQRCFYRARKFTTTRTSLIVFVFLDAMNNS